MLARIRAVSTAALESGALKPLDTDPVHLTHISTPPFLLSTLRNKPTPKPKPKPPPTSTTIQPPSTKPFNPFLPYDPALHVQALPPAHHLLLNKFPVVSGHTLIVTAAFHPQSDLLTRADFAALRVCLVEHDALAFFNSGPRAGASQAHKHLQLVPLPLPSQPANHAFPFAAELDATSHKSSIFTIPTLPFLHLATSIADIFTSSRNHHDNRDIERDDDIMARYLTLLTRLRQIVPSEARLAEDGAHPFAYNLLITRQIMLVVPRRKDMAENGVSVNALGFVGCLLVRDDDMRDRLPDAAAAMRALCDVTFPPAGDDVTV